MSEEIQQPEQKDELAILKARADLLKIPYSNNISLVKLKERIEKHMAKDEDEDGEIEEVVETKAALRTRLIKEATRLIRVRVTNMNPAKAAFPGEIFTVANSTVGTIRKFIPYGAGTEAGYHIPYAIYEMIKRKKFTLTKKEVGPNGSPVFNKYERKEFAIEVLEPLTPKELQKLAAEQAATGRV
jgi:hypothetical protein